MTFTCCDVSDHQTLPLTSSMLAKDVVILKLYPVTNDKGHAWLTGALKQVTKVPLVGFYAADSTPTWLSAKVAAAAHGIDLHDHPFAFDLREFGFSQAHVADEVKAAHADKMIVGHYWRFHEEVGQDWRWDPNYTGQTHFPDYLLWQYTSTPYDQSRPKDGVDLEEFKKATIANYAPLPPPEDPVLTNDDAKQLGYATVGDWHVQEDRAKAVSDVLGGRPKRPEQTQAYNDQYDNTAKKLGAGGGDHKHALSGFPPGTGGVAP